MRNTTILAFVALTIGALLPEASGWVARAEAQVAVLQFNGPRASQVRRQVAGQLRDKGHTIVDLDQSDSTDIEAVASSTGARALVRARIQRRSGRWQATFNVYDASGESRGRATATARGLAGLARQAANRLTDDLTQLTSSRAEPEPVASSGGSGQRVVVGDFSGPGSGRVRNRVVRVLAAQSGLEMVERADLDQAASRLGVDLDDAEGLQRASAAARVSTYVTGSTSRRGGRWSAVITVRDGATGQEVEAVQLQGRNARALDSQIERRGWSRLSGPIGQTSIPDASLAGGDDEDEEDEDEDEDEHDEDVDEEEDQDEDEEDDDDGPSTGGTYNALELAILGHAFGRTLRYNDDLYGFLREYTLKFGPQVRFSGRWYPGAHVTDGFGSYLGIDLMWERAFGIDSKRADGVVFPTRSQAWLVGLRGRYPLERHEFSVGFGYGRHSFIIENSGPSSPDRLNIPVVPGVNYKHLKLDVDARVHLAAGVFARVFAGYMIVLDAGGIEDDVWFPLATAGGFEAGLNLDYELDNGLTFRIGFDVRRYFFDMNVVPDDANGQGDPWVVGGAVDQYFGYTFGIAYRL